MSSSTSQGRRSDYRRSCAPTLSKKAPALVLALVTVPILAATALAPLAVAKDGQKRPDLKITRATASGSPWVFSGAPGAADFSFQDVTKNTGKAAAGRSVTAYILDPLFAGRRAPYYRAGSRTIPRLGPGEADPGGESLTIDTSDLPLGAYALEICADNRGQVRELDEDNCEHTRKEFYVIKADWQGSIDGVGGTGSIANLEQWHSQDAHLSFARYQGNGVFTYAFAGTVAWTDFGGTIHGCIWNGSGTKALDETNAGPYVRLRYGDGKYIGTVSTERFYTITISSDFQPPEICGGTTQGPVVNEFLKIPGRDLFFNQRQLEGRFVDPLFGITWKWDFR